MGWLDKKVEKNLCGQISWPDQKIRRNVFGQTLTCMGGIKVVKVLSREMLQKSDCQSCSGRIIKLVLHTGWGKKIEAV